MASELPTQSNRIPTSRLRWRAYRREDRSWVFQKHVEHYCWVVGFSSGFKNLLDRALETVERMSALPGADCRILLNASGERAGCVFLTPEFNCTARIRLFYLCPSERGLGSGKALLHDLLEKACATGFPVVQVSTYDLHTEACALYRSLGFQQLEQFETVAFGLKTRQINFEWRLGQISTNWFELGAHSKELATIQPDILSAISCVQQMLVHADQLALYDVPEELKRRVSRQTVSAIERLSTLKRRGVSKLSGPIQMELRETGTCRDFSLLTSALLRNWGWASWVRCGFSSYFRSNAWTDHRIVEYADGHGVLRRADAQIDEAHKKALEIDFDPSCVPEERFISGLDAARLVLLGEVDPLAFGHAQAKGDWLVFVNLCRDLGALCDAICGPWDNWRSIQAEQIESTDWLDLMKSVVEVASVRGPAAGHSLGLGIASQVFRTMAVKK